MSKSGFKKGRLGIGTDNPRYPLDVVGDIRLTGGFRDASGNDFNFLAINNQDILKTPDIAGITCVNSKVGIFNVNPSEQLDVSGNINFTGILKQDGVEFGGGVFNGVQYISGSNVSIYISGDDTTHANATGQGNVSLGTGCLTSIALGQENIAIGKDSLNSVTNTSNNIAIGSEALESCISNYNIGIGYLSGRYITSGSNNIAIGFSSMDRQDVGDSNVAIGEESLYYFNNGSGNVALGKKALYGNMSNSGGNHNIGIGSLAGLGVKNGNKNICIGYFAGPTDAMKDYHERLYIDKGRNGTDSFIYGHMDSTNPILAFNAKVGIGKDSPGEHLDVSGNINFTGTLKQDGVEFGGGKFEDGTTSGQIYYNGGNVGIGTTTPRAKLDVYHSKASGSSTSAVTSDNEAIIQELKIRQNVDSWDSITMAHNSYMDSEHQHYNILMREDGGLYLGAETIFLIKTDGSERLRILSNGNVGIGTTSPNYKLEVEMSGGNGGLRVKNTTNSAEAVIWTEPDYASYLYFGANNANKWSISSRASGEGYDLKFYRFNPGALEVMTMDYATGNVGIGTTSPQSQLQIGDFTGTPHLTLAGKNSSATSSGIYFTDNDAGENPINYGMGIQFDSLNNILNIIGDDNGDGTTDKLMTIIRATGNVGIGTTSPTEKLQVNGGIKIKQQGQVNHNSTNAYRGLVFENTSSLHSWYMGYRHAGHFTIGNYNTTAYIERFIIDVLNGNVGIGTTSPRELLNISGSSSSATDILYPIMINNQAMHVSANIGGGVGIKFHMYDNGNTEYRYSAIAGISEATFSNKTALAFYTNNNSSTAPLERMRIDNEGNVGIGTASPARPLEIKTDEQASIQLHTATGGDYARIGINTEFSIGEMNGGDIPWASGRNQMNAFFIEYSGGESNWNNEGAYLWMNGDYTGFANTGDANANGGVLHYYDSDLAPTGQGNGTWYINYDGSITNNSDIRLKENIRYFDDEYNISNIKEKYSQIKFCKYNYKKPLKDPSGVKRDYYGIIAQELELLFPETICQDNKGIRSFKNNVLQCITSHITANLIKENQELKTEVTTLKTELAAIKHHLGLA